MKSWIVALMMLAVVGDKLDIQWTPHPDNAQLWVIYDCGKDNLHPPFYAANVWEITPGMASGSVRRVPTPAGQKCFITANIMRTFDGWDGEQEKLLRAEWQILTYVEGGE